MRAEIADPDEMPHALASHLALHCLLMSHVWNTQGAGDICSGCKQWKKYSYRVVTCKRQSLQYEKTNTSPV